MKRSDHGQRRFFLAARAVKVLFAIALFIAGTRAWRTCYGVSSAPRRSNVPAETLPEGVAKEIGSPSRLANFTMSLEMKENADFLLTPALLVQEALREDIIITYPTE